MKLGLPKNTRFKMVYPAFPYDAKGLLIYGYLMILNPVLFLNTKALYRQLYQRFQKPTITIPFGKSGQLREAMDINYCIIWSRC